MGERTAFIATSTTKTMSAPWTDPEGQMWIDVIAHTTLTAKTPYKAVWNEYGWVSAALTTASGDCYVGFPESTITSGDKFRMQVGGYIEDAITPSITTVVGYGCYLNGGVLGTTGADYCGALTEIGAFTEASTGTTHEIQLAGKMIRPRIVLNGATTDTDGAVLKAGDGTTRITSDEAGLYFVSMYFDSGATSGWPTSVYVNLAMTGAAGSFTVLQGDAYVSAAIAIGTGVESYSQFVSGGKVTGAFRAGQFTINFWNGQLNTAEGGAYSALRANITGSGSSTRIDGCLRMACLEIGIEGTFSSTSTYGPNTCTHFYAIYINGFTAASGNAVALSNTSPAELDMTAAALGLRVGVGADGARGSAYYIPLIPAADWN